MSDQKRPYRMTRRAELEEQTRRRITESAVALHEELGPARTSISAIAERAGVRRSTVYRHFPNEDALFAACSSHWRAANPPPDPSAWAAIEDPAERTETALRELYAFYARTQGMYASLLRDEPLVPIVQRLCATSTATCTGSRTSSWPVAACADARRAARARRSATRWRSRRGAR